jgi:MoxR-like ATPase
VTDAATVAAMIATVRDVHVAEPIERYLVALCRATRVHPEVELGASPRAALAMLRACRSRAALEGRDHVIPDDAKALAPHVLAHRLILSADAQLAGREPLEVVRDVLDSAPAPTE